MLVCFPPWYLVTDCVAVSSALSYVEAFASNVTMCWSSWAAITKHRRLGGLNNKMNLLTVVEAGSPASSGSGFYTAVFSVCAHMAFPSCVHQERFSSSFYKDPHPIRLGLHSYDHI